MGSHVRRCDLSVLHPRPAENFAKISTVLRVHLWYTFRLRDIRNCSDSRTKSDCPSDSELPFLDVLYACCNSCCNFWWLFLAFLLANIVSSTHVRSFALHHITCLSVCCD